MIDGLNVAVHRGDNMPDAECIAAIGREDDRADARDLARADDVHVIEPDQMPEVAQHPAHAGEQVRQLTPEQREATSAMPPAPKKR